MNVRFSLTFFYHHIVNIVFIHYNRYIVYWSKQLNLFCFSNIFTSRIAFAIFSETRFLRMFEKNYIAPKARLRSELYDNFFMFLLFRPYILYFVRTNDMRLGGICGWILFITYHFFLSKLVMILFFNICICNECRKSIRDQTP